MGGGGSGSDTLLFQLEAKNNELIATCKVVQDLRKRERELTDRLVISHFCNGITLKDTLTAADYLSKLKDTCKTVRSLKTF